MEGANSDSLSIEQVRTPNIPEVQKDVEFITEHLNDPIASSVLPHMIQERKFNTLSSEQVQDYRTRNVPGVKRHTEIIMEHLNDPNFELSNLPSSIPDEELTKIYVSKDDNEDIYFNDDSPYLEVRAAVSSVDDPLMPVNTFRMWVLGFLSVLVISGLNKMLELRYPSIAISVTAIQLLSLFLGRGLAAILPTKRFKTGGYVWSLNPGPFSIKEHTCITVMANITVDGILSTEVILAQRVFYGQTNPMAFQILLALGSQSLSICFGGLLRQFVVWPSSMIWPSALVNCTLLNTLHHKRNMVDEHFFYIAMAGSFIWFWVPGYLFTALSMFNWICWIAPNDTIINVLFGTNTGLGMSFFTFDWGVISESSWSSPLATPWWCQMNIAGALVIMAWLIGPVLYFTNIWNAAHFPIFSFTLFDNTGSPYNAQEIITNSIFDPVKYAAYSPVYIPMLRALGYGSSFATFTSTMVHTFLWFRKDIARRFHNSLKDEHDIHSLLMQHYPEVPMWWYGAIGIIAFTGLCTAIKIVPTQLPIWAAVVAVLISFTFTIPFSILRAVSNLIVPIQVMNELIAGYILPGRPIANMICKTIGYTTGVQTITFTANLKLAHYMKIPPRIMFTIQLMATTIACIWTTFIQQWMFDNVQDICTSGQKQGFTCPGMTIFATSSVIFGAVGPQRLFGTGSLYSMLLWFFPIGFFAPIPFYLLARRFPHSIWRYINVPAFFVGGYAISIAPGITTSSYIFCGFIFNYVIRRFHLRWWMRYNYLLSAALDAGTAISMTVILLTMILPKGGIELNWWGNTVWQNTADAKGTPFKPLPESGFIGPATWS